MDNIDETWDGDDGEDREIELVRRRGCIMTTKVKVALPAVMAVTTDQSHVHDNT